MVNKAAVVIVNTSGFVIVMATESTLIRGQTPNNSRGRILRRRELGGAPPPTVKWDVGLSNVRLSLTKRPGYPFCLPA
jgi:hypothetical protein